MQFVPWRNIADWHCKACGYCCKLYSVVLSFPEWLRLTGAFGLETAVAGLNRFYIKRVSNGSCTFLFSDIDNYYCGLQNMKPEACKLWPFKVLSEPKYGQAKQATYDYGGLRLYIYADTMCCGLRYGAPTWDFCCNKIREFAELSLGITEVQCKTTRAISHKGQQQWGRKLFP
jgi:Fe-S-cluster containining protein